MGDLKAAEARKARLALALRENVRRRKAQARKRQISPVPEQQDDQQDKVSAHLPKAQE